ncbi:MAG: glycerate kinase [Desulfovibrionaceae bacterium]
MNTVYLSPQRRQCLDAIFSAGLTAVAPDAALKRYVCVREDTSGPVLCVADERFPLGGPHAPQSRLFAIGAGKGAAPMAQALESVLGDYIYDGHVIVKYAHGLPLKHIRLSEAAHPVPDAAGEHAARQVLALAHSARAGDLVLCLLTGGASALTPAPSPGISLADIQATTALLLGCGASIHELNAVRKHLSVFSGGQLARAAQPATVISLIVSDVVGDDLDVIASGPTAPDASTYQHCLDILKDYALTRQLPPPVLAHLQTGVRGALPETPKVGDPLWNNVRNYLVATLPQALKAAADKAASLGFSPHILSHTLKGEARVKAAELITLATQQAQSLTSTSAPVCLLAGGETTVTLKGQGKGGRNQEMALAASLALQGIPNVCALFAGTDGTDGPTDAAGGYACGDTIAMAARQNLNAQDYLDANNSYPFLSQCQRLCKTGPTRTNVMDMSIMLVYPKG